MRNFATLTKYYGIPYNDLLEMPYAIFLSYLKYAQIFELEKTKEGQELLAMDKTINETTPEMDKLKNLTI